jgi:hypothetical protein
MADYLRFEYTVADRRLGTSSLMPFVPLILTAAKNSVEISGLLDSGATVNAVPFSVGLELGFDWNTDLPRVQLSGNLARYESKVIRVQAVVGNFEATELLFAWSKTDGFPPLLGQTNFFMQFDVCFYRSRGVFDIRPRQ